jgi:hypothetical protein
MNGRSNGQAGPATQAPAIFSLVKITLLDGTVYEHARVTYSVAMISPTYGSMFVKEIEGNKTEHVYPLLQLKHVSLTPSPISGISLISN